MSARKASDDTVWASGDTSDMTAMALSVPSGGAPLDGYVQATKAEHRTVRLYPPAPLSQNLSMAPILLLTNAAFAQIVSFAGATQSPMNGTIGLVV